MLNAVRRLLGREPAAPAKRLSFSRPLVLLHSDDWGRVGVRDREGYELLRASGVHLGENPYDYYSLETAEDVIALRDLLKRHRDSTGRPACLVMNFLLANVDFQKTADTGFKDVHLRPLSQGLPGGSGAGTGFAGRPQHPAAHFVEGGDALHLLANALDRLRIQQSRKTSRRFSGWADTGESHCRGGAGIPEVFCHGPVDRLCARISRER